MLSFVYCKAAAYSRVPCKLQHTEKIVTSAMVLSPYDQAVKALLSVDVGNQKNCCLPGCFLCCELTLLYKG